MHRQNPHQDALRNFERASLPEDKMRYPLRDTNKSVPFKSLGFSEEADNWKDLRYAIVEKLPFYPASLPKSTEYGDTCYVDVPICGPSGKEAPVRTAWIYRLGEDFPRITSLYINTRMWQRMGREKLAEQ